MQTDYLDIWRSENDKGNGFAVGEDESEITEIEGYGELTYVDEHGQIAVYSDGQTLTLVADGYGPWAVQVPAAS